MKHSKIYSFLTALSMAGILLAVYLLWQQYFRPAFQPCNVNSFVNCDAIVSGPVAKTFGISTPLFGLVGYIVIFFASLLKKSRLLLTMAGFGLAFCLYIAYVELFQLRVICPVCILCQVFMITIFVLGLKLNKKSADGVNKA